MASMALGYGLGCRLRNAVRAYACAMLIALAAVTPAVAATPKLLILGNSLTAGFGLPLEDGFQAQMRAALEGAQAADGAVRGRRGVRATPRRAVSRGSTGCWPTRRMRRLLNWGRMTGCAASTRRQMEANLTAILDTLASRHIPVLLVRHVHDPELRPAIRRRLQGRVPPRLGKRPGVLFDPFFLADVATVTGLEPAGRAAPERGGE